MTVSIVLLVIGFIASLILGWSIMRGQQSRSWPSTSGTILQSAIDTFQSTDEDGSTSTTYGVRLQYQFSVGGRQYEGSRRAFTNMRTSSYRRTQKILDAYPQGGAVTVFYDPDDPSSCVLEPGVNKGAYVALVFTVAMLLVGAAGLLGLIG